MSLAHTRKPIRVLGMVIILIITVVLIYLLIMYISNYNITKIAKLNDKYMISETDLIPDDYGSYISDLKKIGNKYTGTIIEYVYLYQDAKKIDRAVNYAIIENQCITRITIAKIDTQIQDRDELLEKLKAMQDKKLEKIYWNEYIDILENRYAIDALKTRVSEIPFC